MKAPITKTPAQMLAINTEFANQLAKKENAKRVRWVTSGTKYSQIGPNFLFDVVDGQGLKSWQKNLEKQGIAACCLVIENGFYTIYSL